MAKHGKLQTAPRPFRKVFSAKRSIPARSMKVPVCSSSMQTTVAVSTSLRRESTDATLNGGPCIPLWAPFAKSAQTVEIKTCYHNYWKSIEFFFFLTCCQLVDKIILNRNALNICDLEIILKSILISQSLISRSINDCFVCSSWAEMVTKRFFP